MADAKVIRLADRRPKARSPVTAHVSPGLVLITVAHGIGSSQLHLAPEQARAWAQLLDRAANVAEQLGGSGA